MTTNRVFALTVVSLSSFACQPAAAADDIEKIYEAVRGTMFVKPYRAIDKGQLIACGLQFSAFERDFVSRGGAPVKLSGTYLISEVAPKGSHAVALKLGLLDDPTKPATQPSTAFVKASRGDPPTLVAPSVSSEPPGFGLYASAFDQAAAATLRAISEEKKMVVSFKRRPDAKEISTAIDLTVETTRSDAGKIVRIRSEKAMADFDACTRDLLKLP